MARLQKQPPKTVKLMIVQSLEGRVVSLNRVPIAGPRPGLLAGKIIEIWDVPVEKIRAIVGTGR